MGLHHGGEDAAEEDVAHALLAGDGGHGREALIGGPALHVRLCGGIGTALDVASEVGEALAVQCDPQEREERTPEDALLLPDIGDVVTVFGHQLTPVGAEVEPPVRLDDQDPRLEGEVILAVQVLIGGGDEVRVDRESHGVHALALVDVGGAGGERLEGRNGLRIRRKYEIIVVHEEVRGEDGRAEAGDGKLSRGPLPGDALEDREDVVDHDALAIPPDTSPCGAVI